MIEQQEKIKSYGKEVIKEGEDQLRNALCEAQKHLKQGQEQVIKWTGDINKQTHENPWPVVAGVGVGCLLLGLLIGKSKN